MKQLNLNRRQIVLRTILKSYIWVLLPISIFGGFESCSTYIDAKSHLTPYSINVSGYHRQDGTYVRPHKRRPPGSVKKDAPWKEKMFLMGTIFLGSMTLGIGSIFYVYNISTIKINKKDSRINSLVKNREAIHKDIHGKEISRIISNNLDFGKLPKYPRYLLHDNQKTCAYKHKELPKTHFHVKYKAVKYYYRVCLEHVKALPNIGRGQPRSKYINEIEYYEQYDKIRTHFRTEFQTRITKQSYYYSIAEMDEYFYLIYKEKIATNNDLKA